MDLETYRKKDLPIVTEYDDTYDQASWESINAACEKNDPAALYEKGIRFYIGETVEKNEKEGIIWLERVLQYQKHTGALRRIGEYWHDQGENIEEQQRCLPYLTLGSELGSGICSRSLGFIYGKGELVEKDYEKAVRLLQLAIKQGDNNAKMLLGMLYQDENDYVHAAEQFQAAMDSGIVMAFYAMGRLYFYGDGVEKSYEKALSCFLTASENGSKEANIFLGWLYGLSDLPEKDPEKGLQYLDQVIETDIPAAYRFKGQIYESQGQTYLGTFWMLESARKGDPVARKKYPVFEPLFGPPVEETCREIYHLLDDKKDAMEAYKTVSSGLIRFPEEPELKYALAQILDVFGRYMTNEDGSPAYDSRLENFQEAWEITMDLQKKNFRSKYGKLFEDFLTDLAYHYGETKLLHGDKIDALEILKYTDYRKYPEACVHVTMIHMQNKETCRQYLQEDSEHLQLAVKRDNWNSPHLRSHAYKMLSVLFFTGDAGKTDMPYAYELIQKAIEIAPKEDELNILETKYMKAQIIDSLALSAVNRDGTPDYSFRIKLYKEAWEILHQLLSKYEEYPEKWELWRETWREVSAHYADAAFHYGDLKLASEMIGYADKYKSPEISLLTALIHHSNLMKGSLESMADIVYIKDDIERVREAVKKDNWSQPEQKAFAYYFLCVVYTEKLFVKDDIPYAYECIQKAIEICADKDYKALEKRFSKNIFGKVSFRE